MHPMKSNVHHQVRLWLEPDGCPVLDTTSAIAARKRATLLDKDQGRNEEYTVSGVLSACLTYMSGHGSANKGKPASGKQAVQHSSSTDTLWIFHPDTPATIRESAHLVSLTDTRWELLQAPTAAEEEPPNAAALQAGQQQPSQASLGPSWGKLQQQLLRIGEAAVNSFQDLVGYRISVWWPDDGAYYDGMITDYYSHSSLLRPTGSRGSGPASAAPPQAGKAALAAADPPKKRGRPPKHTKHAPADAAVGGKDTSEPKKRGMPARQRPAAADASTRAAHNADGTVKKRGRPPKPRGEIVWGKHRIEYDDGEVELLDLAKETWHITKQQMDNLLHQTQQRTVNSNSSSSSHTTPSLPAAGDTLITFAVDRPATTAAAVTAAAAALEGAAPTKPVAAGKRAGEAAERKTGGPAGASSDSSSSDDSADDSSDSAESSGHDADKDTSDNDADSADFEPSQGPDQQHKTLKRKRQQIAATVAGKRSKLTANSSPTPSIGCGNIDMSISSPAAAAVASGHKGHTRVAEAATVTGDCSATAATPLTSIKPEPLTAAGEQLTTGISAAAAPKPPPPATAATAAAAAENSNSSKPQQQSPLLGILASGLKRFTAVGSSGSSQTSLQAATAAAAAAAIGRAVAARAAAAINSNGSYINIATNSRPAGMSATISPQPSTKSAAAAAVSPTVSLSTAAAAAAQERGNSSSTPSSLLLTTAPTASATLAAAAAGHVSRCVSPAPVAAALMTPACIDSSTNAAAAAALLRSSSGKPPVCPGSSSATPSPRSHNTAAMVAPRAAVAAAQKAEVPTSEVTAAVVTNKNPACVAGDTVALDMAAAIVVDRWQHVPVLKAEAAAMPPAAAATPTATKQNIASQVGIQGPDAELPGSMNSHGKTAATTVAAVTPARKLLDELTARLGHLAPESSAAAAVAAAAGDNDTKGGSSSSSSKKGQMRMLLATDNLQFSLLADQPAPAGRGKIGSLPIAGGGVGADHGRDFAAAGSVAVRDASSSCGCLAVLLMKLPAGFDHAAVNVQSSSRGLKVSYQVPSSSSSSTPASNSPPGAVPQHSKKGAAASLALRELSHAVCLPSDMIWEPSSGTAAAAVACAGDLQQDLDGGASGTAVYSSTRSTAMGAVSHSDVVGLLQYSDKGGKLMVLGKCRKG